MIGVAKEGCYVVLMAGGHATWRRVRGSHWTVLECNTDTRKIERNLMMRRKKIGMETEMEMRKASSNKFADGFDGG